VPWLRIISPRWAHELQRWLVPGDVVEVTDVTADQFAHHAESLTTSPGHDVPEEARVTLRARHSVWSHCGEHYVAPGSEFVVPGRRAREIPAAAVEVLNVDVPRPIPSRVPTDLPKPLPPMTTRPATTDDESPRPAKRAETAKAKRRPRP